MLNRCKLLALTGLFLGLFVGASSAQDECATATATGEAMGIALDTTAATTDAVTASCGLPAPDVWLAYTASCTGTATIETTSGPGGDTVLEVLDACGGTVIACDDDGGVGFLSLINLSVTSGTTYFVRASGWNGGAGAITLDISCAALAAEDCADGIDNDGDMLADCDDPDCAMDAACLPPANDECATATATGEAMGIAVDSSTATTGATTSSCGLPAPDVWLAYTAGCSGIATIETTSGPGGDTILEVLDACGGTVLACDDDGGAGFLSLISLTVTSGTTYWVRASGWNGGAGPISLDISCAAIAMEDCADGIDNDGDMLADCDDPDCAMDAACLPPANDDCANATPTGEAVGIMLDSTNGTVDGTFSCGLPAPDVWLEYTPSDNGLATITTTAGPGGDTILEVLDACGGMSLGCDDDGGTGFLSTLDVPVSLGSTYAIRLSGWNGGTGAISVDITLTPAAVEDCVDGTDNDADGFVDCSDPDCAMDAACLTPDNCVGAVPISVGVTPFDTTAATTDTPMNGCSTSTIRNDLWYEFTAGGNGTITISTCDDADFDTRLAIFTDCNTNTCVAQNDDGPGCGGFTSQLSTALMAGTYYISVGAFSSTGFGTGNITLSFDLEGDECVSATAAADGLNPFDTTGATASADDNGCSTSSLNNDVWLAYTTGAFGGTLTASTCNSANYDTKLAMYDGSCGALNCLDFNDDSSGCSGFTSEVSSAVAANTTYYIRVGGFGSGDVGSGDLDITFSPDPPVINEIRIDQAGADNDEYVELSGAPQSLDGMWLITIGDGAGGSGVVESIVDLTGSSIGASTYFVVAEASFSIGVADLTATLGFENGDNVTHLLVSDYDDIGAPLQTDLDTDDDGVLDIEPWTAVLDCVALVENFDIPASGDYIYCSTTVGPDGSFVPAHAERCPDSSGPFSIGLFADLMNDTPGAENSCLTPQPNDECAGATELSLGDNVIWTGSATTSMDPSPGTIGMPACTNSFGQMLQDAWFTWTSPGDGTVTLATAGSEFDTDVALYDGDCMSLNLLGCDGDGGGGGPLFPSLLTANVTAGTTYIIRCGGWGVGEAGAGLINVSFSVAGDECDTALPAMEGLNAYDTTLNTTSADVADDTQCAGTFLGEISNDGWWSYSPTLDGTIDVSTVGLTMHDTDLVLYEGTDCTMLTQLACNGDAGPLQSEIMGVPVTAGENYLIRLGGWGSDSSGVGDFEITFTPAAVAPTASFTISPLQAIAPLEATLIDASDNGMDGGATIDIDWGDMTSDMGLAPGSTTMHTYAAGTYTASVTITNLIGSDTATSMTIEAIAMGDCDLSGGVDVGDAIGLAQWLFSGGMAPACAAACDVNGDGVLDLADVVYSLLFQFSGGAAPVQPAPNSGC